MVRICTIIEKGTILSVEYSGKKDYNKKWMKGLKNGIYYNVSSREERR